MSDDKIHISHIGVMLHALRRKSKLIDLRASLTNLQKVCNPIKNKTIYKIEEKSTIDRFLLSI
jgi:hypothetical protein